MPLTSLCDEADSWENAYFQFVDCLRVVSSTPADSAHSLGHFNVAGELWLEVRGSRGLWASRYHRLSPQHIRMIEELASAVEALPADACYYTESREESLRQLEHPAWQHPRELAARLLLLLQPVTASNREYIFSDKAV